MSREAVRKFSRPWQDDSSTRAVNNSLLSKGLREPGISTEEYFHHIGAPCC